MKYLKLISFVFSFSLSASSTEWHVQWSPETQYSYETSPSQELSALQYSKLIKKGLKNDIRKLKTSIKKTNELLAFCNSITNKKPTTKRVVVYKPSLPI